MRRAGSSRMSNTLTGALGRSRRYLYLRHSFTETMILF